MTMTRKITGDHLTGPQRDAIDSQSRSHDALDEAHRALGPRRRSR